MYRSVVFKHQSKFNLLITSADQDLAGRTFVSAHYILPTHWTEDDCYDYGLLAAEEFETTGKLPIEHRVVG